MELAITGMEDSSCSIVLVTGVKIPGKAWTTQLTDENLIFI